MKTYDGTLLNERQKKETGIRLFKWLDLLENALVGKKYLCGDSLTMADVSVLPRVALYPLIGFLTTDEERRRYPNLTRYMERLADQKSITAADRQLTFGIIAKLVPWSIVEWIGNWRSAQKHHRVYGMDVLSELKSTTCGVPVASEPSSKDKDILLYHHTLWPGSIMTRIACLELGIRAEVKEVNMILLEHRSSGFLALNPNGEVPTACYNGRVIFDPMNTIEYLSATFADLSCTTLLPDDPTDRIRMRMWNGWTNTCFNYQFIHLYKHYIVASILKSQFSSEESLLQALHKSTTAQEYTNDLVDMFNLDMTSKEVESKLTPYKLGLEEALQYLNRELSGKEYLVGSKLSGADLAVFSLLMFFQWAGISISRDKYPNVAVWMEKLTSVPSISVVLNEVEEYMHSHGLQTKC